MQRLALVLALAQPAAGCAGKQLTNRQVALGAISAAAVIGIIVLLSLQCNDLTSECE